MNYCFFRINPPKRALIVLGTCFLLNYYTSSAQTLGDSIKPKEIQLEEVTVEANRSDAQISKMPSSVQIITKDRIQGAQATLSLEESLRSIPGVYVNNRFNFAQGDRITIRGIGSRSQFGVRGIKMVLDGIPLTFPDGQSQLNNIDISSLGKIEVIKGASSVLYGNSAGGVIYLRSENSSSEKLTLTPSYLIGSYGLRKAQMKFSGRINKFSYLINTDRTEYDGYRDFCNSLFYNLNTNFKYQVNENSTLTLIVNGNESPYLLNPGSLDKKMSDETPRISRQFNKLQGAGKKTKQLQSGLSYSLKLKSNQKIDLTAYGIARDLYNPIPGRIVELERKSSGFRATYNNEIALGTNSISLTAGYDYENQLDKRKEFINNGIEEDAFAGLEGEDIINKAGKGNLLVHQHESTVGNGLFAKLDFDLDKLTITGGARFDNYKFKVEDKFFSDNTDNSGKKNLQQVNPTLGLVYNLSDLFNFFSNYSSAFQTPSANEFGNLPSGAGGFNQDLKPERIKSIEGGVRGKTTNNLISYNFSFFYMDITNQLIGYQTDDPQSDEVFYRNAGKTSNKGLEAFVSVNPIKPVFIEFGYSGNNFRFEDYVVENGEEKVQLKGKKVPGVPMSRLYGAVRFVSKTGFMAEVNIQHTGEFFANDFNGKPDGTDKDSYLNESYTMLDFRVSYQKTFNRFSPKVFAGANNILDEKYNGSIVPNAAGNRFFEPAARSNFYLGLSLPIIAIK